ncbi:hypothetical protein [Xylophilus sp. GOD-11R]|uniref:hypothetical protein n=1 Tax=Xylophilus sp. GOD-11R TaxID=3089814 RepID=UPI00298BD1D1|nr:hypothetical protein [Xylophilus sp. GOD-11R]WPB59297.1 hypothetical protein R9X41_11895 [Xylophilus sp. GOD-11R]
MSDLLVGSHLARLVAARLEAGSKLFYSHPEYCGMGLQYTGGAFIYAEVYDGKMHVPASGDADGLSGEADEYRIFRCREEFIAWLTPQTDESLMGQDLRNIWLRANQRLTIARLRKFVL